MRVVFAIGLPICMLLDIALFQANEGVKKGADTNETTTFLDVLNDPDWLRTRLERSAGGMISRTWGQRSRPGQRCAIVSRTAAPGDRARDRVPSACRGRQRGVSGGRPVGPGSSNWMGGRSWTAFRSACSQCVWIARKSGSLAWNRR
jgi:hypothetical protein